MKKMLLASAALALLITGCTQQTVYCSKQTGGSSTETITHHFFVSGIGQKTVDAAKICGGAENVVKTKPSKHILAMDCSVLLLLGIYTPLEAYCVLLTIIITSCPSI